MFFVLFRLLFTNLYPEWARQPDGIAKTLMPWPACQYLLIGGADRTHVGPMLVPWTLLSGWQSTTAQKPRAICCLLPVYKKSETQQERHVITKVGGDDERIILTRKTYKRHIYRSCIFAAHLFYTNRAVARWVYHSPTLGKNITHPFWYLHGKCPLWLI